MHAIQRPKFIITIGEHFSPDKPIAKFHSIKFEGKVYEIRFFFLRACIEISKNPRKNSGRQPLHEVFKSQRLRVTQLSHYARQIRSLIFPYNDRLQYDSCWQFRSVRSEAVLTEQKFKDQYRHNE